MNMAGLGPMRSDQDHGTREIAAAAGKTRPVGLYNDNDDAKKKKKSQTSEMTPW